MQAQTNNKNVDYRSEDARALFWNLVEIYSNSHYTDLERLLPTLAIVVPTLTLTNADISNAGGKIT